MKGDLAERASPLAWAGIEAAAAGSVLGYGVLLDRVLPGAIHLPASLAAASLALYLARRAGVTIAGLGLDRARLSAGLRAGLLSVAPIAAAVAVGVAVPWSRRFFLEGDVVNASTGRALYEMLVRIPFATALPEELLFRGALLGLFTRRHRPWVAVALTSALFGVWHISPTLQSLATNPAACSAVSSGAGAKAGAVAGVVAATAMAGAAFSWLRLRSGSVLAPWIAHASLNSLSFLGGRIGARLGE